ncbi:MAG: PilZ domain-containing protein, partial [bacterium]|nr:PilZ domain-containing protein [bacterium]
LSLGGMAVLVDFDSDLAEGPVEIIMDLSPHHRDVSLMGRVLRSQNEYGKKVGIQFVAPEIKEANTLQNFLNSRCN